MTNLWIKYEGIYISSEGTVALSKEDLYNRSGLCYMDETDDLDEFKKAVERHQQWMAYQKLIEKMSESAKMLSGHTAAAPPLPVGRRPGCVVLANREKMDCTYEDVEEERASKIGRLIADGFVPIGLYVDGVRISPVRADPKFDPDDEDCWDWPNDDIDELTADQQDAVDLLRKIWS